MDVPISLPPLTEVPIQEIMSEVGKQAYDSYSSPGTYATAPSGSYFNPLPNGNLSCANITDYISGPWSPNPLWNVAWWPIWLGLAIILGAAIVTVVMSIWRSMRHARLHKLFVIETSSLFVQIITFVVTWLSHATGAFYDGLRDTCIRIPFMPYLGMVFYEPMRWYAILTHSGPDSEGPWQKPTDIEDAQINKNSNGSYTPHNHAGYNYIGGSYAMRDIILLVLVMTLVLLCVSMYSGTNAEVRRATFGLAIVGLLLFIGLVIFRSVKIYANARPNLANPRFYYMDVVLMIKHNIKIIIALLTTVCRCLLVAVIIDMTNNPNLRQVIDTGDPETGFTIALTTRDWVSWLLALYLVDLFAYLWTTIFNVWSVQDEFSSGRLSIAKYICCLGSTNYNVEHNYTQKGMPMDYELSSASLESSATEAHGYAMHNVLLNDRCMKHVECRGQVCRLTSEIGPSVHPAYGGSGHHYKVSKGRRYEEL